MLPEVVVVQEDRQERKPITTLLLVDDEAPVLEATTWALRTAGFRIYSASSFDAALNILASQTAVSGVIIDRGLVSADLAGSLGTEVLYEEGDRGVSFFCAAVVA